MCMWWMLERLLFCFPEFSASFFWMEPEVCSVCEETAPLVHQQLFDASTVEFMDANLAVYTYTRNVAFRTGSSLPQSFLGLSGCHGKMVDARWESDVAELVPSSSCKVLT